MSRWPHTLLALILCTLGLASAQGQVLRCTDPTTGKVSYTDAPCPNGQRTREVLPSQSPEDIARERAQAEQALQIKYARQQQETARRQVEQQAQQQAELLQLQRQALQRPPPPARRRHDDQAPPPYPSYPAYPQHSHPSHPAYPPARPLPPPPPPKREITHCNVFRCYDKNGSTYPIP